MYNNRSNNITQESNNKFGAGSSSNFASLLSVIKQDEDAMEEDLAPQFQTSGLNDQTINSVTDSVKATKDSMKGLAKAGDDDDCFVDEDALMSEPLQLISRNKAMKVESGLLRQG